MYNLYTEEWGNYEITDDQEAPSATTFASAVMIGRNIFMFGGRAKPGKFSVLSNALWKLNWTEQHRFLWSNIKYKSKLKSPSPRTNHGGWEYADKLWIFGGRGLHPDGYLDHHGQFTSSGDNNQLLCFDPSCEVWQNPKCFGDVPAPPGACATTILGNNVWMFGTQTSDNRYLHQLDMNSLTWTMIQTGEPKPYRRSTFGSLTVIAHGQLVLHGNHKDNEGEDVCDTWIFDIPSLSWWKFTGTPKAPSRWYHTCTPGINNGAIVIGGVCYGGQEVGVPLVNVHVMMEPKSLQQLAIQTVYKNKTALPCEVLPKKLRSLLSFL